MDLANGNLEVYALGTNGDLEEPWYSPTTHWNGNWNSLGSSFAAV